MQTCVGCGEGFTPGMPFCPHCGATAEEDNDSNAKDPLIGQVLARKFRVLTVIGDGGMGRVYKAEQVPLGVEVVIKTLHAQMAKDPEVVKRFFREAQAASRLRHPNCVSILDFGESDSTLYIAMEFLRGQTLSQVMYEAGQMDVARCIDIVGQVLDVVEAAHRMNVVHRDLKPDNIMVEDLATRRDFVKVLDFGVAKIVDPLSGGARMTQAGMVLGTPAYMSPEQALGKDVDGRADLYSIGVIAFELLTGELPIQGATSYEFLAAHASKAAPLVRSVRPDIPENVAAVIDRALMKRTDERPESALDFKQQLEGAVPIKPRPTPRPAGGTQAGWSRPRHEQSGNSTMALAPPGRNDATPQPLRVETPVHGTQQGQGPGFVPCPRCKAPLAPTAKFCAQCGATTGRSTRMTQHGDKFAELRRFLPSGIVDEISKVRGSGPSEKRDIIVMAVDVKGLTLKGVDPAASEGFLDQFHGGFSEIALRHSGRVDTLDDGTLVVLFGLTMSHADDAEKAVRAALGVSALVRGLNESVPEPVTVSTAIHAGPAMIRQGEKADYTAVGDTVELPTQLASATGSGKIVVSERIHQLVRGTVKLRKMANASLQGRTTPVASFEVLGLQAKRSEEGEVLAPPPMVGREHQVERIVGMLSELGSEENAGSADRGAAVNVVGQPGSGKTRFLEELTKRLKAERRPALLASAIPGTGAASVCVEQILAGLGGSGAAMRSLGLSKGQVKLLHQFLPDVPRPATELPEKERQAAIVVAVRGAVAHLASRTPVLVAIDDAHLADEIAAALIRQWVEEPVPGVLFLAATRLGHTPPWEGTEAAASLRVCQMSALNGSDLSDLVAGALTPTPPPTDLVAAVVERAGGSPLMALEVLRTAIDAGLLHNQGGRWTVTGDPAALPQPEGLRALYAARIDRLPEYAHDVLACAAVYGHETPVRILDRIVATAHQEPIDRELGLLRGRGLLIDGDQGSMRFAEGAARDVVLERLPEETRSKLHRAVAATLIELGETGVPELIASHFADAGVRSDALDWYGKAAEVAINRNELGRARDVLTKSRNLAKAGVEGDNGAICNRRVAEDSLALGDVLLKLGALDGLVTMLTEGLACAQKDDDPRLIATLKRTKGRALLALGRLDAAGRELERALEAAVGLRDIVLQANLTGDLGEVFEKRGELDRASQYLVRAIELIQGASSGDVRAGALHLLTALGRVSLRNRDPDRAEKFLHQGLSLAEELDDLAGATKVLGNLAGVYHLRGDYKSALAFVERALHFAKETGDQVATARQLNNLGTLATMMGDKAGAKRHFDAALVASKKAGWREGMATAAAGRDRL